MTTSDDTSWANFLAFRWKEDLLLTCGLQRGQALDRLVQDSSVQFIYVATVVKFVGDK